MKNKIDNIIFIFIILAGLALLIAGCTVKDPLGPFSAEGVPNTVTTNPGTGPSTNTPFAIVYSWEDGTTMNWYSEPTNFAFHNDGFSVPPGPSNSTLRAHGGTHSLKVHTILTDAGALGNHRYQNGIIWVDLPSTVDLSNKKWKISICFTNAFGNGYDGYKLCFKDSAWTWGQSFYTNFIDSGHTIVPNTWLTLSDKRIDWAHSTAGFNSHQVKHLGFQLCGGWGNNLKYNGYIFIDDYSVYSN